MTLVHIIHPLHGDQDEGVSVRVRQVSPGHVHHLVVGRPCPAVVILSRNFNCLDMNEISYNHQRCGVCVVGVVMCGEVEDVAPHHLPHSGVRHDNLKPVVSAWVGHLGEAGLAAGTGGRHHLDNDQGHGK